MDREPFSVHIADINPKPIDIHSRISPAPHRAHAPPV